jgi:hypothetical protein
MNETLDVIHLRIQEIQALRTRAAKQGEAVKTSCIDDKLRRLQTTEGSAKALQGEWAQLLYKPSDPSKYVERLQLLRIYAVATADAAYACVGSRTNALVANWVAVSVPQNGAPTLPTATPPSVDRPPLASSF